MKGIIVKTIVFVASASLFSCADEKDKMCCLPPFDTSLADEWLLFETGYSPGAGYFTKEVSAHPAQKLILKTDQSATITVQGLEKYKYFRVLAVPESDEKVLALYETDPGEEPQDVSNLKHSYVLSFAEGRLTLAFRWCIEGCHMAFKRI